MGYDVVGLGASTVSYVCVVPGLPKLGERLDMGDFAVQGGGPASTATVVGARLGLTTRLLAKVGDDSMGQFLRAELAREGVDVAYVGLQPGGSTVFDFILVQPGGTNRAVVHNAGSLTPLAEKEMDRHSVQTAGCLLLDPYEIPAAVRAAGWAREGSVPVLLNADAIVEGVSQLIPMCDYLICPLDFATSFAETRNLKRAVQFLLGYGPSALIVTMGERGSHCATRTEQFSVPAYSVDVQDTTGAREVFHGACAMGVLKGWELRRMVEFASAAAALKCTAIGPRDGIPHLAEVERFILHQRGQ